MSSTPNISRQDESWQTVAVIVDVQNRVRHLGQELRHEFDAVAREPLPREFILLLSQLDKRDQRDQ